MAPHNGITLCAGALRLALRPDLGGSVAGLWHEGQPVLRSVEADRLAGPRQSACFPLLPYSNRLGHRHFDWQGHSYTTQPNFDDSPHSLHGVGWLRSWQVAQQTPDRLTLRYAHEPDGDWPFAFTAEQHITLTARAVRLDLRLRNTDARAQPVGLGWHPYFPKREGSYLQIDTTSRWERDALQLPTHATRCDGVDAALNTLDLDHCFAGWHGHAHIRDEHFVLRLWSNLPYLVSHPRWHGSLPPPASPHSARPRGFWAACSRRPVHRWSTTSTGSQCHCTPSVKPWWRCSPPTHCCGWPSCCPPGTSLRTRSC